MQFSLLFLIRHAAECNSQTNRQLSYHHHTHCRFTVSHVQHPSTCFDIQKSDKHPVTVFHAHTRAKKILFLDIEVQNRTISKFSFFHKFDLHLCPTKLNSEQLFLHEFNRSSCLAKFNSRQLSIYEFNRSVFRNSILDSACPANSIGTFCAFLIYADKPLNLVIGHPTLANNAPVILEHTRFQEMHAGSTPPMTHYRHTTHQPMYRE